jgi:hypothetical protein
MTDMTSVPTGLPFTSGSTVTISLSAAMALSNITSIGLVGSVTVTVTAAPTARP